LAGAWDDTTRREIEQRFAASTKPYAPDVLASVTSTLDEWTREWTDTRTAACQATHELAEQSESLLDLRMACLDTRLTSLRSITARLREAEDSTIERAVELVGGLPDLAPCSDTAMVLSGTVVPVDLEVRHAVAELEPRIADIVALRRLGRDREALERVDALVADAREAAHPPTLSRVLQLHGELLEATGDAASAEAPIFEAARLAELAGDARQLARARNLMALAIGDRQDRPREGRMWAEMARTAVARAGGDPYLEAEVENNLGLIADREGKYTEEIEHLEAALSLFERSKAAPAMQRGGVHNNLAGILGHVGRFDEARAHARRAREIWESEFGESHPRVAIAIATMALIDDYAGDYAAALEGHRVAVARYAASVDEHHPTLAELRSNLAVTLITMGDYEAALAELEKVLTTRERVFGKEHAEVAGTLANIAGVLRVLNRHDEALPLSVRAVELEELRDPDSPGLALSLSGLANTLEQLGRKDEALPIRERVIPLIERAHGADSQELIVDLANLASTRGACGQLTEGREAAERALAIAESREVAPDERAFARLVLAELLVSPPGRDAARAKQLAQAAADDLSELPAPAERAILEKLEAAERWQVRVTPPRAQ
jgi:tetratricopeptide (TPR) repeat protein